MLNVEKIEAEGHDNHRTQYALFHENTWYIFSMQKRPEIAIIVVIKSFLFLCELKQFIAKRKSKWGIIAGIRIRIGNWNDGRQQCFAFNLIHVSVLIH